MNFKPLLFALLLASGCDSSPIDCDSDSDCAASEVCQDSVCVTRPDGGGADGGASDSGIDSGPRDAGVDAGACTEDCGDGLCIAGECCEAVRSCDGVCCGATQVCSFSRCVDIGLECFGAEDCAEDEYCEISLGESSAMCGSVSVTSGRCLPLPPACPDGTVPDPEDPACIASCSFTPAGTALAVQKTYSWGVYDGDRAPPNVDDVRNSPIVINLDDDDGCTIGLRGYAAMARATSAN